MKDNLHAIRESELQQVSNVLFDRMKKHGQLSRDDCKVLELLCDVAERPVVEDD